MHNSKLKVEVIERLVNAGTHGFSFTFNKYDGVGELITYLRNNIYASDNKLAEALEVVDRILDPLNYSINYSINTIEIVIHTPFTHEVGGLYEEIADLFDASEKLIYYSQYLWLDREDNRLGQAHHLQLNWV